MSTTATRRSSRIRQANERKNIAIKQNALAIDLSEKSRREKAIHNTEWAKPLKATEEGGTKKPGY